MKKLAVVLGAALIVSLAGCASNAGPAPTGGSTAGGTAAAEVTSINVGVIPTADAATVYVALDQGYFADEGLQVNTQVMQNAAAIVPGVMNGQVQFGSAAIPPVISAVAQGLPLKIVANGGDVPEDRDADPSAVVVKAGSDITSAKDLSGKTIAVNALQAMGELVTRQAIDNAGGDASTTTFVAMAFPDMANAVERGDVDAAFVVEPFLSTAVAAGLKPIARTYHDALIPGESDAIYFTSEQFIQQAPGTVAAFTRALNRAAEASTADPQLIRDALVKYGNIDPSVAAKIYLPGYSAGVPTDAIQKFLDVMVQQGFLTNNVPSASDLVYQ